MVKTINFTFNNEEYQLERLGDDYHKKYAETQESGITTYPYENCSFFKLNYLGEKDKITDGNETYDYMYTMALHSEINRIINERVINGELESKITAIQPEGNYRSDDKVQELYHEHTKNQARNSSNPNGYALPHLVVTNLPNNTVKEQQYMAAKSLRKVTILPDIKKIEGAAFCACPLEEIELSEGLVEIGSQAFGNNYHIKNGIIPKSVQFLGWDVFWSTNIEVISIHADNGIHLEHQENIRKLNENRRRLTFAIQFDDDNPNTREQNYTQARELANRLLVMGKAYYDYSRYSFPEDYKDIKLINHFDPSFIRFILLPEGYDVMKAVALCDLYEARDKIQVLMEKYPDFVENQSISLFSAKDGYYAFQKNNIK